MEKSWLLQIISLTLYGEMADKWYFDLLIVCMYVLICIYYLITG